jgi:hypothetical protein
MEKKEIVYLSNLISEVLLSDTIFELIAKEENPAAREKLLDDLERLAFGAKCLVEFKEKLWLKGLEQGNEV